MMPERARLCQALRGELSPDATSALLPAAVREGVDAWLAARIAEHDAAFGARWAEQRRLVEREAMRRRHALAHAARALDRAGIEVILLRGWGVALRHYGDDAALRPISDHDLLIAPDRFRAAKQVLWEVGFRPDPVYKDIFVRGDVQLDLHWEPLGAARIRSWRRLSDLAFTDLAEGAEPIEIDGVPVRIPSRPREFVFLAFHALKHSFERLIWLWDIALAARAIETRGLWDETLAFAERMRLVRPLGFALRYAHAALDAPAPAEFLRDFEAQLDRGERRLLARVLAHETPPFLAERVFARMQPDWLARLDFWRETIWPAYEVRAQIAGSGCVKCNFIRKRIKQAVRWGLDALRLGRWAQRLG